MQRQTSLNKLEILMEINSEAITFVTFKPLDSFFGIGSILNQDGG